MVPKPVKSDLRFAARVDYFETAEDAEAFYKHVTEQGFTAQHEPRHPGDLYGVWWVDRKGEGWYG